jgi:hypothetical protein
VPDLAFNIQVLDQVIASLTGSNDPRGTLLQNHRKFAVLGVMGPDLLQYRPVSKKVAASLLNLVTTNGTLNTLPDDELQEVMVKPLGAIYSVLFSAVVVPVWPKLNKLMDFLNRMDVIAQQEDEIALVPMRTT